MLSTILWTRHDRRFTLSLSRITAVISESCFVLVKACLISRRAMSYLRISTPPLLQAKLESILCQRLIQSRDKSMLILQIYPPPHPPLLMALLSPLHRYLHSRSCLPTVLSRLSITQHWSLAHLALARSNALSLGQQMWCSSPRHYYDHWQSIRSRTLSQVLEGGTSMSVTQKGWSSYHTQEFQTGKQFGFLIEAHWESTLPSDARAHGRHESIPERSVSLQGAS